MNTDSTIKAMIAGLDALEAAMAKPSLQAIAAYHASMAGRCHSDRDFSGGSLPDVGSVRESEERNM